MDLLSERLSELLEGYEAWAICHASQCVVCSVWKKCMGWWDREVVWRRGKVMVVVMMMKPSPNQ
jgi:hypothetical protein